MSILAAGAAVKGGLDSIGDLARTIRDFQTNTAVSLPAYLKSTNIMSRVYIEEPLADEDIILPLMGMLNQVYCGFVLTALQMSQFVSHTRTVRNLLETVASEDYNNTSDIIENKLGNLKVHNEETKISSFDNKEQKLFSGRVIEVDLKFPSPIEDPDKPETRDYTAKVALYIQLIPYLITDEVAKQVIGLNVGHDLGMRYKKMKAGEISFFWDFMFERDLINDKKKALKEDRTGLLHEILLKQTNNLSKALLSLAGILPKNHNLANSILIIDSNTFKSACNKANSDFSNKNVRTKFFKESFLMLLVIVDTTFNSVTIYFNGLDTKGTYSFKMIQANSGSGSSGSDKYDLKDIMTALSHGMTPKF